MASSSAEDPNTPETLGIEVEFLVPYLSYTSIDPHPEEQWTRRAVRISPDCLVPYESAKLSEVFSQTHVFADVKKAIEAAGQAAMTCSELDLRRLPPEAIWRTTWLIKHDLSLDQVASMGYDGWTSVEINSPILNSADRWDEQVKRVVDEIRRTCRARLNQTCGLHIHVGLPGGQKINLLTLKKLTTILWLGEHRLLKLYHPSRRDIAMAPRIRKFTKLAAEPSDIHKMITYANGAFKSWVDGALPRRSSLETQIRILWRVGEHGALRSLMGGGRSYQNRTAYSFACIQGAKGTIEFRQMEGSLDPAYLKHWGTVCVHFLRFARRVRKEAFQDLLRNLLKKESEYGVDDFLQDIGVDRATIEWFRDKFVLGMLETSRDAERLGCDLEVLSNASDDSLDNWERHLDAIKQDEAALEAFARRFEQDWPFVPATY